MSGLSKSSRERSSTELAHGVKSRLPTPSKDGQTEETVVDTILCVRYKFKFAFMPGQPESIWRAHDVKLHVPRHGEGTATLSLTKINKKKAYKVGQATEGLAVDEENRTKVFPLDKLDLVDRGIIPEKEAVKFDILDENGNTVPEWRYGSLLFVLMFQFEQEYVRLELCCNSTDERDLWAQWFTDFIVNTELNEIREVPNEDESSVALTAVIDRPKAGVQQFMVQFLAGGKSNQAEEDSDPSALPDKGKVTQLMGAKVAKRKLVCPETGVLLVKDSLGFMTKVEVDLEHALVQVESPWQPAFSVKMLGVQARGLPKGEETLYFKCSSIGARQKMVDWLIGMRGVAQTNAETYNEDSTSDKATERASIAQDEEDKPAETPRAAPVYEQRKTEPVSQQEEKKGSGESAPVRTEESDSKVVGNGSMDSEKVADDDKEDDNPVSEQQKTDDDKMKALLAYPIDTVLPDGDKRTSSEQPLRGEWCRVQYHRLGQRPTSKSAFEKRFVTINPRSKKLTVLSPNLRSAAPALVELDLRKDVKGITTMSARFGLLAITFHCETQPIVVHLVPATTKSRHEWIDLLTSKQYNVKWFKERMTEDVESASFKPTQCYLCGKDSKTTPVCRTTMLQHGEFVESIKDVSDIQSIFQSLPPRSVRPVALQEAIEKTEALLEKAKLHRRRADEALLVQ